MSYYFDSFGAPPPVEIINFTKKKKGGHLLYNNWIIQDLKSESCGWYCLGFLLYMWKNRQNINMKEIFNQFVNNFVDDALKNEALKIFIPLFILGVLITFLICWYQKINKKHILLEGIIILLFVLSAEILFLNIIISNYKTADTNFVKMKILKAIKTELASS